MQELRGAQALQSAAPKWRAEVTRRSGAGLHQISLTKDPPLYLLCTVQSQGWLRTLNVEYCLVSLGGKMHGFSYEKQGS